MTKLILGSHVSMSAPKYYLGSVEEALSYGANTLMIYTGAPQNAFRKPVNELNVKEGRALLKANRIEEKNIVVHAPYIINIGNKLNTKTYEGSKDFLVQELTRVAAFHLNILVLHPGSHVKNGLEVGLTSIVEALDDVLGRDGTNVKIALETMAGKGSEVGSRFEEIKYIIDHVKYPERLGVCLDTCHIHDAGYDVHDVDALLRHFDEVIGLDKLLCLHINDSKNERGAKKDRHANLGYGEVGFKTTYTYVNHPLLKDVPKILETPYINGKPPYKHEIEMLRSGQFQENWVEKLSEEV